MNGHIANYYDWLNTENKLTPSGYDPEAKLLGLLENSIDTAFTIKTENKFQNR